MAQSEYDPVESVAKGAVKAAIEWTEEKILQVYRDFKNKKLAFIEDPETIECAKKQRQKGEWAHFKTYMPYDEEVYTLFQTGLTLREYEEKNKQVDSIVKRILKRYKSKGLHVAWFAQNGLFSKYVANILETGATTQATKSEVENLFKNIDDKVVFINQKYGLKPKLKIGEIITKIHAHSPETFIISSVGGAMKVCEKIKNGVMKQLSAKYICEFYESEQKGKLIYFLNRIEDFE